MYINKDKFFKKKMSCICRNSGTFLCGGCKKQAYCSSACAKQDWQNDHQKACIGLKLQSKEGDVIEIGDEKISKIKTFQDLIEETGTSERALLLNFDTDTIQRIKLFAEMDNRLFELLRAPGQTFARICRTNGSITRH